MFRIIRNIFSKRYHHIWLTVSAWALIAIYVSVIPYAANKGGDFVHLWIGGHMVAQGELAHLYEPAYHYAILEENQLPLQQYWGARYEILGVFFYPSLTGFLYAPLGALPLYWAQATQAVINIGLGICAAWLLTQIIRRRLSFSLVLLLLFTFPSFFFAYVLGQNGILTTTLVLAGWYLLRRQRVWWAGIALSLLAYKPNWILAIGWIPIVQRQWRVLMGIGSGLLLLLLFTIGTGGIASIYSYLEIFAKLTDLHDLPDYPLTTQYSILSFFRRHLGLSTIATLLGWSCALGVMAVTIYYTQRYMQQRKRSGAVEQHLSLLTMALAWVAAVCINPHLHHYDLTLVVVAMIVAVSEWPDLSRQQRFFLSCLFVFNHLAFVLNTILAIDAIVPLPLFAMLALWGWLLFRIVAENSSVSTSIVPGRWMLALHTTEEA